MLKILFFFSSTSSNFFKYPSKVNFEFIINSFCFVISYLILGKIFPDLYILKLVVLRAY